MRGENWDVSKTMSLQGLSRFFNPEAFHLLRALGIFRQRSHTVRIKTTEVTNQRPSRAAFLFEAIFKQNPPFSRAANRPVTGWRQFRVFIPQCSTSRGNISRGNLEFRVVNHVADRSLQGAQAWAVFIWWRQHRNFSPLACNGLTYLLLVIYDLSSWKNISRKKLMKLLTIDKESCSADTIFLPS